MMSVWRGDIIRATADGSRHQPRSIGSADLAWWRRRCISRGNARRTNLVLLKVAERAMPCGGGAGQIACAGRGSIAYESLNMMAVPGLEAPTSRMSVNGRFYFEAVACEIIGFPPPILDSVHCRPVHKTNSPRLQVRCLPQYL